MALSDRLDGLGDSRWIEPLERAMETRARRLAELGDDTMDALSGQWLGHPVHLALTDVPLGAWTAVLAMDVVDTLEGEERMSPGAELALGVGIAGAAGAAITGLADWHREPARRDRRVGVVHGLMSGGATALMVTSLVLRKLGARPQGRAVGLAGYAIAAVAAAVGGHLAMNRQKA